MSTNRDCHVDDTTHAPDDLSHGLLLRPVERRWLLKLAGTAALGLAHAGAFTSGLGSLIEGAEAEAAGKPTHETYTLHFALGALPGLTDLTLHASGGQCLELQPHTARTRARLKRSRGIWSKLDHSVLTHFVSDVRLPAQRGMLLSVHGQRGADDVLVAQTWHAPRAATVHFARLLHRTTGSYELAVGSPQRLLRLGVGTYHAIDSPDEIGDLDTIVDATQTAVAFTMCHPSVSTIDPTAAAATKMLLGATPAIETLGSYIDVMQNQRGEDWATMPTVTDADGSPSQFVIGGTTTTLQTIVINRTDQTFVQNASDAIASSVLGVRATGSLGAVIDEPLEQVQTTATWVQTQGALPEATLSRGRLRDAPTVHLKHKGTQFGTKVTVGAFKNATQVPLRVCNNFVRWVGVYVQYLMPGHIL